MAERLKTGGFLVDMGLLIFKNPTVSQKRRRKRDSEPKSWIFENATVSRNRQKGDTMNEYFDSETMETIREIEKEFPPMLSEMIVEMILSGYSVDAAIQTAICNLE